MIRIETKRNSGESSSNVLRRFMKRVQGSGVVRKAKSLRYRQREQSELKKKLWALKKIERRETNFRLWKLGKIRDASAR